MGRPGSLLLRLHKWAWRQDENFTTEALAYALEDLARHRPNAFGSFMVRFTDNVEWAAEMASNRADSLKIRTQLTQDLGRPDLIVESRRCVVFVETKVASAPTKAQVIRHRADLDNYPGRYRSLVLLTRDPVDPKSLPGLNKATLWHEVAEWLRPIEGEVASVKLFLDFLRERAMAVERVGEELLAGLRSLASLGMMLRDAVAAVGLDVQRPGWSGAEFGVSGSGGGMKFWIFVSSDAPARLRIQGFPIDERKAQELDRGEPAERRFNGHYRFVHDLSERDFFALDMPAQRRVLAEIVAADVAVLQSAKRDD